MKHALRSAALGAVAMLGAGCADVSNPSPITAGSLAAFQSVPAGFSSTSNTFAAEGDLGEAFVPRRGDDAPEGKGQRGGRGGGRGDGFAGLMGGGLGREFFGLIEYGKGRGRGPFHADNLGSNCAFASDTGLVTCGPVTKRGLTVVVTAAISTVDGTVQEKVDALTDKVVAHSEVSGTITRRNAATSVVAHRSDRTVAGLSDGATERTVSGVSVGTETTTGTNEDGSFTAVRTVNDTTTGIVIPLRDGRPTYPTAGRVSRNMSATITVGGSTTTHSRSEVITYDGSTTATVVITQDGVTKTCSLPLPRGRMTCQ